MHVDLTKPDPAEPRPTPAAVPDTPTPEAVEVEEEPVRLTAREELMLPLKAFGGAVAAGSPVLARRIAVAAWHGIQAASRTRNTTAPTPDPKKADLRKDEEPVPDGDGGGQEEAKAAPPAKGATAAAGIGDAAERFAMGVLVIGLVCVGGGGVLAVAWSFVAPYAGWIVPGVIVAWCLTAAHYAPATEDEDATENDHENEVGEQDQEQAPETDSAADWARKRLAIRRFVEEAVAAGAAGYREEKGRGATVDSLLAEMRQKTPLPGWDRKRMIEFLESADIPVREQVSFYVTQEVDGRTKKVKKNLPAVHIEDLAKELGKTPALPPRFVPDITPGAPPYLTAVPAPIEPPAEAPAEGPEEGRSGAA